MSNSIFDLEQQILKCWNITDDLDMLYKHFGDSPKFSGLSAEAEDEMLNLLLGFKATYDLRFEQMWKTFEKVCREYHKRGRGDVRNDT